MTIEMAGQKLIITFVEVAATTEVYKWKLHKIKNPGSLAESDPFTGIISRDKFDRDVQEYNPATNKPSVTNA